jgi:uncharacterized protein YkwD
MSILALFFLSFFLNFFGKPYVAPPPPIKIATVSATIKIPAPPKVVDTTPWGTTEKIDEHIYRTYVGSDEKMGTPEEILKALNNYRQDHHIGQLSSGDRLCDLANKRAKEQSSKLDSHKGLIDYMNDPNHWQELNITQIGENASYGYTLSGVHLIEWVFNADEEHKNNQLNPNWTHACAGTFETTADIIFGKR